ncbi:MAG: gamma-glutamyltransferase [Tissierellia bacterium]|jgi:gamma-glutamyltranspeptidase/glutathione hydrolase|nr:gamma-glutamyltransferase [Tissierellia bacterium]
MKRRILSLLLALLMILSMGCNQTKTPAEEPVEEQAVENTETAEVEEEEIVEEEVSTEDKWAKVEDTLSTYKYNEFISFDENLVLKTDGRDAQSENGIVSTQKYEASKIGSDIISKGGNAVDAAVAASFALGVCEPNASGLGGGGFMTLRDGETGEVIYVDFREVAPLESTDDMYLDENGEPNDEIKSRGGLSVAVPGEVAGLLYILEEYGTMSREEVLQPAIELAENGFLATPKFIQTVVDAYDIMFKFPELGKIYLQDDLPFEAGDLVKNPDLAKTLKIIAEQGSDGFYKGEVAEAIVRASEKYDGIITLEDLSTYEIEVAEPVRGTYRGYEIISSPPPSSGGAHLIQILNILENHDMSSLEPLSAEYMHIFSEAFKMTYADRAKYMGDPKYVDVPLKGIMSKEYGKVLYDKIDLEKSQEFEADDPWKYEGDSTTHLSVADKEGNMVAITKTINYYYGSGVVVDGYGFILNNEMDDFSPMAGEANSVAPKKKPLSSMSPTIMLKDGEPFMVLGTPGGMTIFAQLAQIIVNVVDNEMDLQAAIDLPRIWDGPSNVLTYMDGVDLEEVKKTEEMGHKASHMVNDTFGFVQAIMYKDGQLYGGADAWTDAKAVGY